MSSPLSPGTKLGRYEIRSLLGTGGMGDVYRVHDEKLNRDVAIKVLPTAFSQDVERLRRFEHEAQMPESEKRVDTPRLQLQLLVNAQTRLPR